MTFQSPISACHAQNTYTLARNVSAIQILSAFDGSPQMGTILQLPAGTQVRVCGDGFNDRTVKVTCEGGNYFVFSEDLEPERVRAFAAR